MASEAFLSSGCWLTFDPQAVTFFETAVTLFKSLPTYDWLSQAGITPDSSKTYTLDELQSAIQSAANVRVSQAQ